MYNYDLSINLSLQFNVDATDNGVPPLSGTNPATVIVNVVRNRNPPFFIGQPYSARINSTLSVGAPVYDIDAQDSDTRAPYNTIQYDVIGDDVSPVFFTVESQSGQIRLTQSILMESELIYPVSVFNFPYANIPNHSSCSIRSAGVNILVSHCHSSFTTSGANPST